MHTHTCPKNLLESAARVLFCEDYETIRVELAERCPYCQTSTSALPAQQMTTPITGASASVRFGRTEYSASLEPCRALSAQPGHLLVDPKIPYMTDIATPLDGGMLDVHKGSDRSALPATSNSRSVRIEQSDFDRIRRFEQGISSASSGSSSKRAYPSPPDTVTRGR